MVDNLFILPVCFIIQLIKTLQYPSKIMMVGIIGRDK